MVTIEQCDRCSCTARYTTAKGDRTCGLCGMGEPSLRDTNIPAVVMTLDRLLTVLEEHHVGSGLEERQLLRGMIGRWAKGGVI